MKSKTFDCIEMKRRASARIYEKIKDMSIEEQKEYWQEKFEAFAEWHKKIRREEQVPRNRM